MTDYGQAIAAYRGRCAETRRELPEEASRINKGRGIRILCDLVSDFMDGIITPGQFARHDRAMRDAIKEDCKHAR